MHIIFEFVALNWGDEIGTAGQKAGFTLLCSCVPGNAELHFFVGGPDQFKEVKRKNQVRLQSHLPGGIDQLVVWQQSLKIFPVSPEIVIMLKLHVSRGLFYWSIPVVSNLPVKTAF